VGGCAALFATAQTARPEEDGGVSGVTFDGGGLIALDRATAACWHFWRGRLSVACG
jgi:hypothetical protein